MEPPAGMTWLQRAASSFRSLPGGQSSRRLVLSVAPAAIEAIPANALDEYHDLFSTIDEDGSGDVTTDELRTIFTSSQIRIAEQELQDIIQAMDSDGTGSVTFVEFASIMHGLVLSRRDVGPPRMYAPAAASRASSFADLRSVDDGAASGCCVRWLGFVAQARAAVWELMDDPSSSPLAQLISWWILAAIAVSVATFIVETVPGIHRRHDDVFETIELVCMVHFLAEFGLRLLSCPSQREFWTDALNLVDFAAIAPFFAELLLQSSPQGASVIRAVRLVRIFRVIKVSRYLAWLRVFAATVVASVAPLGMIMFVIILAVILLSSAMYFVERGVTPGFDSIPEAMWWTVMTMTTIGFGRVYPVTVGGKLIGAIAATTGVVILAIPISVIATNFQVEFSKLTTSRAAIAKTLELQDQWAADGAGRDVAGAGDASRAEVTSALSSALCLRRFVPRPGPQASGAPEEEMNPIVESVVSKIRAKRVSLDSPALQSHWSAGFLRTSLDAIVSSRRRLMSNLKQVELRNRDSMIDEAASLVTSLEITDRGKYLASEAEKELF